MINGKEFDITSEDKSYITPRVYITRVGEFSVYIAQGGIKRVFFLYVYDIYRYHIVFLSSKQFPVSVEHGFSSLQWPQSKEQLRPYLWDSQSNQKIYTWCMLSNGNVFMYLLPLHLFRYNVYHITYTVFTTQMYVNIW